MSEPRRQILVEIACNTGSALANAASEPEPITVIVPEAAPDLPPETGESSIRKPASSIRLPNDRATSGDTVEQHRMTAPLFSRDRQPAGPNNTSSVCAA